MEIEVNQPQPHKELETESVNIASNQSDKNNQQGEVRQEIEIEQENPVEPAVQQQKSDQVSTTEQHSSNQVHNSHTQTDLKMKQNSLPKEDHDGSTSPKRKENTDEENFDVMCCGLPMSPPNKNEGPWEKEELWVIPIVLIFIVFIAIGTTIGETSNDDTVKEVFGWLDMDDEDDFKIVLSLLNVLLCWFLLSPIGWLVYHQKLPIEIGRKAIHIMVNLMTFIVFQSDDDLSGDEYEMKLKRKFFLSLTWYPFTSNGSTFFALMKPMRKINPLANYAFHSMDRPGDRPNTLLWKTVNYCNTVITNGPYIVWCAYKGMYLLQIIPFFCIGFGDGLAEPVGRIWGKHKYKVKALFTSKRYTRSYEGSFTVFFFSLVGVLLCAGELSGWQTVFLALTLPITQTIIEAVSPHTSDNGFMMIGIWLLVFIALEWI